MRRTLCLSWLAPGVCLLAAGCLWPEVDTINDYKQPPPKANEELADDKPSEKPAPPFDPALVDRRLLDGWLVNSSAAVLRLDVPAAKPDVDGALEVLHPSYVAACKAARRDCPGEVLLPSVNLLDGKAKQFDDGLYAAIDLAYCRGMLGRLRGHTDLIKKMYFALPASSTARPFLAAGLALAGINVPDGDPGETKRWLLEYESNPTCSRPAGFYTWNEDLKKCFRFLRFFQREFPDDPQGIVRDLAAVLGGNKELRTDYERAVAFYRKLTNPNGCHDLLRSRPRRAGEATRPVRLAVFPASGSKENALFDKLFAAGLPPSADLMNALIHQIRSGKIDLRPRPDSGWYEYQVYALETMLLPGKGEESAKLLLTRRYKKRMLEAFKAVGDGTCHG